MPWSPCPIFEKSDRPISAKIWEVRIEIIFKNEFRFGGLTVQEYYRIPGAMCVYMSV